MSKRQTAVPPPLPHSLDAERSVLGGVLIENAQIAVARETLTPEMFFRKAHEWVWSAIDDLDRKNFPVDLTTVKDELERRKQLEEVGVANLSALVDGVPRSTNVAYYAELVKDYWLRRQLVFAGQRLLAQGYHEKDTPIVDLIADAETTLLNLSRSQVASDGFINAETWAIGGMQQVRHLMEHKSNVTGLPTGIPRLDFVTRGLQPGNLIVAAGRPSMGKTALVMQIARHAARSGEPGVVTLEMNKTELWMRSLAQEAQVDLHKILTGHIDEKDGPRVMAAGDALEKSGFNIDESPSITAAQIRSRCKRLATTKPLNLLVIDYLQLMDLQQRRGENMSNAIGRTTRMLKQTAKELHIPIILLSQLSRGPESRNDKRPLMSDLRESGNIEQDADMVWLLFREDYYFPNSEKPGQLEVIIAKQRNGPLGTVELYFEKKQTRFVPWSERPGAQAS